MKLVKVLYTNFKVSGNGHISNKVKSTIKPADWITLCNLSYEGRKLSFKTIPKDLQNDESKALNNIIIPQLHGQMVMNAGRLNINGKLLIMCLFICCHLRV